MAFCKNCGEPLNAGQDVCLKCGTAVDAKKTESTTRLVEDNGGFGWGLLGFCIPIVGLVLFLVWKSEKPKTANALIVGAVISIILGVIVGIVYGANV